jgi:hypothetical protein
MESGLICALAGRSGHFLGSSSLPGHGLMVGQRWQKKTNKL